MNSFANMRSGADPNHPALQPPAHSPGSIGPILLMINSLETGGSERQFVELARSLRAGDFNLHLACLLKKGPLLEGLGDLHDFNLGGSLYGTRSIKSRWALARHLRKLRVQVAHAFDFYSNLTLVPAARLARVPVVIGSHRQLGDLLTPAQFRAQLTIFRWCDRVVCNSRAAAERLLQAGLPDGKLVVIGNALPPEAFARAAPALARADAMISIGMIARMNASYKNHHVFLAAAARLIRKFPGAKFLLVGDGPLRPDLERQAAELGLQDCIQFLGDRRDITAVLATLDVSVVPSASESLSNVMLESMAAGVPVVATEVGGNSELACDGRAVLVAPNDVEALVTGISHVLEDRALRTSISGKAREFAQANFSVERIRDQYCSLYAEVLASRSRRRNSNRASGRESDSDPRIRVAFVAPSLRYVGGQAVQADLLMRNWQGDTNIEASFLPVDPQLPHGFRWVERVPFLRTMAREPLYLLKLWQNLKDVDIAHIFSASYSSFLLAPLPAWFVARLRDKKTLINYRSGECRDHLKRSAVARHVLKNTDRLVVPSGHLVGVMREFDLQAWIVPNIVDLSQFSFRLRNPLRPHLVCTRGFHPYYGIDVVVRAFAEVQKSWPDAQLDLVGGGALEHEIKNLVQQLGLTGINFWGVASRREIGKFYDQADIFLNASNLDNMPVSVLEAFASGTPVVTTAPEGMSHIVDHGRTGLLSEPGDPAALAANVLKLLNDPELAALLARNAFKESSRYTWNSVREQWLTVYRDLVPTPFKRNRC
jgi:L-malate glycosyltransferase